MIQGNPKGPAPNASSRSGQEDPAGYKEFNATELYCPKCRCATPVRERLLLVLPGGDLYDYMCTKCGTSVGSKTG
ncbi:hypothetical protein OAO01_03970 [Oligoflexia bacterium]|nr:hypothetical protein [Oligoflexia bacterium]